MIETHIIFKPFFIIRRINHKIVFIAIYLVKEEIWEYYEWTDQYRDACFQRGGMA